MGLIATLMLSCRKATELTERRELRPLTGGERLGLWFHSGICAGCRRYKRDSMLIDQWLEHRPEGTNAKSVEELQARIIASIDR